MWELQSILIYALFAALGIYLLSAVVTLLRPTLGRYALVGGAVIHFAAMVGRGYGIGYFPLTNKLESFSAASLAVAIVACITWRNVRLFTLPLMLLAVGTLYAALHFPWELNFPPPLMYTIWYPLHVPLSFFSYALWAAAAVAGVCFFVDRQPSWLKLIDRLALYGFGLWTLSMICGGIWGVLAWGAYFMWDPKVIWSAILWFHYASFVHVRLTPALQHRQWVRPALAIVGFLFVFIAYVGTSFFFGRSSHAF